MSIQELDSQYIAHTYNRFPVVIASGKGSIVTDENGKDYIDLGSGIAVNSFGVADDEWQAAVTAQLGKVAHTSNLYYAEPVVKLAELLCTKSGMARVFFSNTGAEANETAIKVARKYAAAKHGEGRNTIVTLKDSFHGRTLTTLAATGQDAFHQLFQPLTPGFTSIAPSVEELRAVHEATPVAGILMELVQGEGGVNVLDADAVREIADYCAEQDILLMLDEVQTGNGRTGEIYAFKNFGIEPDVVTTAKGLAGGLPLGATLLGEKVQDVFGPGDNGTTFGGNPTSCAGAISIMSRVDDALLAEVREKSAYIMDTLGAMDGVTDVSGLGLLIGFKTVKPAADVVAECLEKGVLCLTAKDRVRLLPALNIPKDTLVEALAVIADVVGETETEENPHA